MADDVIGSPTLRVKVDPKQVASGLDAAVSSYKQGLAKVNAAMQQAQAAQARVTKQIQGEIDRINATQATNKLQILSQAIDQMGGKAKLSDDQVKRLTADVERLAAAGGKVPKSLAAFQTPAGPGAGAAVAASLQGTLASSGPGGAVGAAVGAIGPQGAAAAATLGGVALAFGLAEKAADAFLKRADELNNISGKTGLGTEFLQKLDAAGAEVGVTLEASSGAVFKLEKTIGEAVQGNKQAAQSFQDIGLSVDQLKGKSPEEQFKLVAGALATIDDQAQFVAAGTSVMGKGFGEVAALIRSDFTTAMENAVIVSNKLIQQGDAIGDAFARLGKTSDVLKIQLGAALLQAVTGSSDAASAIDKVTRAVGGLAKIIDEHPDLLRIGLSAATGGLSELAIRGAQSGVGALAGSGGGITDDQRARLAQSANQEAITAGAQRRAEERAGEEERKKAAAEAAKAAQEYQKILDEIAADEQKDAIEANKRWQQEQDAIEKTNAAIRKHISALQVGVFGTSKQAAVEAAHEFDLLRIAINSAGGSIQTMTAGELSNYEQQLIKIEHATRSDAAANQTVRKTLREVQAQIDQLDNADGFEQPVAKTKEITVKTVEWSSALADVAHLLQSIGGSGGLLGSILGGVSGIGAAFDSLSKIQNSTSKSGLGGLFGSGLGNALKSGAGVLSIVQAGVGIISSITHLFGDSPEEKAAKTAASVFGHEVSQALAKTISEDAARIGDRVAATLLHISDAIDEAGGVKGFGFDNATKAAHDLFSEIETGKLSVAEAGSEFDKVFGQLLPEAIDKTTGIAKQSFLDLIKLDQQFGTNSQQVQQFIQGQTSKVVSGLQAVAKGAEVSAKSAPGLGAAFVAAFNQLVQAGATPREAFAQLGDSLAQMQKKFKDAGVDGGAAFAQLAAESGLLKDEVAGPLYDAIAGAGDALAGLANTNALTPEAFAGLSSTISETFAKLEEQGKGGSTGLAIIAPQLQELYELEQRFGFTADEATQKLIDQGKAAGLVGEEHKSVQEQTLDVLKSIAEVLGAKIPEAAKKGAAGVKDAFKDLKVDEIKIPYSYEPAPGSGLPGGAGMPPDIPKHGAGNAFLASPQVILAGEVPEFVHTVPQIQTIVAATAYTVAGRLLSKGGSGGAQISVNIGGTSIEISGSDSDVVAKVSQALDERDARLVEAVESAIERVVDAA